MTKALEQCIQEEYNIQDECRNENLNLLIDKSQLVFAEVWKRAKYESGINDKENELYEKLFGNK